MLKEMQDALIAGKKAEVEALVDQALAAGMPAGTILNEGLIPGMERLGVQFKANEVFIPEVLVAARAMNAGLAKLEPHLAKAGIKPRGIVVIGTVKGDLHDIGKNLVAMMLRGNGYKIVDLGVDVSPEKYLEAAKSSGAERHRPVRPADDDDGPDEGRGRGRREGRARDPGRHRRGARHPRLRRPDPRPRLRSRRRLGGRGDRPAHRGLMTSRRLAVGELSRLSGEASLPDGEYAIIYSVRIVREAPAGPRRSS